MFSVYHDHSLGKFYKQLIEDIFPRIQDLTFPEPASMAQLNVRSTVDQGVAGSSPTGAAIFFRGD